VLLLRVLYGILPRGLENMKDLRMSIAKSQIEMPENGAVGAVACNKHQQPALPGLQ
jgi:hypothetical protein